LAAATGRRLFLLAAEVRATGGSTIRNIVVAPLIGIGRPRTDLGEPREVTLFPTARPMPGNRLGDRAVIWQAIAPEDPEWAVEVAAEALATGRVAVEQIASEVGISREAVAGTGMHSEGARGDIADQTLAAAAVVAPPAWDLAAGAEASVGVAAVVVGGAGRRL
jgi:hypothetical protein